MDPTSRTVRENYERVADAYDGPWADVLAVHGRAVADRLPLATARRVAELGCGPGRVLPHLATLAPHARVIGADLTESMLRRAPAAYPRVCADAQNVPFADATLDAVLMPFVLFHLPDLPRALRDVRRVLRPGGSFGSVTWGTHDPHPAYDVWVRVIDDHGAPPDPSPQMPSGDVTSSPGRLEKALNDANFSDVTITAEPFRYEVTAPQFIAHGLRIGAMARRIALLPDDRRAALVAAAEQELSRLPSEAFVESGTVLYTTAVAR